MNALNLSLRSSALSRRWLHSGVFATLNKEPWTALCANPVWQLTCAQYLVGFYQPLTEEESARAMRKDDGELLREIEKALDEIENRGALGAVLNRWIHYRSKSNKPIAPA